MKTIGEIEELKASWEPDPHWDIEDTEGFEEHYKELLDFRCLKILEWRQKTIQETKDKAAELGCPENLRLAEYVMSLESRIEKLEGKEA